VTTASCGDVTDTRSVSIVRRGSAMWEFSGALMGYLTVPREGDPAPTLGAWSVTSA